MITDKQRGKIFALFNEASEAFDREPSYFHGWAVATFGVKSLNDLDNEQVSTLVGLFENKLEKYYEEKKRREPYERGIKMKNVEEINEKTHNYRTVK